MYAIIFLTGISFGNRPNPPMRRTSSGTSSTSDMTSLTDTHSTSPPPPPAPQPHIAMNPQPYNLFENDSRATGSGNDGSNSTTPRGSMENLPPPPPDLLNSDDDEINIIRPNSQQKVYAHTLIITKSDRTKFCRIINICPHINIFETD